MQGFDLEALHGAGVVIEQLLAMQSEVSVQPIYDGMPNMNTALESFHKISFKITGLYPVTRDTELGIIEFDCVMRRNGGLAVKS